MGSLHNTTYATYIVECADGTLYTGYAGDLDGRLMKHNAGEGAKYTKSRRPVFLKYHEVHYTRSDAMKREAAIKKLTRQKKLNLIENAKT